MGRLGSLCTVVAGIFFASWSAIASPLPQMAGHNSRGINGTLSTNLAVRSVDFKNQTVVMTDSATRKSITVHQNQRFGIWTLMAVVQAVPADLAVFENVEDRKGDIVYADTQGIVVTLPQTAEPTSAPANTLYVGRTLEEVANSKQDVLSPELLAGKDDPSYDKVAAVAPPLRVPSFVGTPHGDDKPTYDYGGFSDEIYADLGKLYPEMQQARDRHDVWEGLIGGWLPVLRFVFPSGEQRYWEETIFADEEPGHFWTQPVWYRALLVESGELKQAHYFYHHLPFPPRGEPAASEFYKALLKVHSVWQRELNPPMKINVPDQRILDFCLRSLSLQMITRVNDHPKYGYPPLGGINVFGGYGYDNVDTFQDTFNSDVSAFLEWGLFDIARRYIDDYFTNSVRDDGSIDTRGPEIGQYGKMLTVVAKYYSYTKDEQLLRKHQKKIQAIAIQTGPANRYHLRDHSRVVGA
jgi:hypothetical protein